MQKIVITLRVDPAAAVRHGKSTAGEHRLTLTDEDMAQLTELERETLARHLEGRKGWERPLAEGMRLPEATFEMLRACLARRWEEMRKEGAVFAVEGPNISATTHTCENREPATLGFASATRSSRTTRKNTSVPTTSPNRRGCFERGSRGFRADGVLARVGGLRRFCADGRRHVPARIITMKTNLSDVGEILWRMADGETLQDATIAVARLRRLSLDEGRALACSVRLALVRLGWNFLGR